MDGVVVSVGWLHWYFIVEVCFSERLVLALYTVMDELFARGVRRIGFSRLLTESWMWDFLLYKPRVLYCTMVSLGSYLQFRRRSDFGARVVFVVVLFYTIFIFLCFLLGT